MARVCLEGLELALPERLGARAQRLAHGPFLARERQTRWDLTRNPYDYPERVHQWLAERLHLGDEAEQRALEAATPEEAATLAAAATAKLTALENKSTAAAAIKASNARAKVTRTAAGCPDRLSYVMTLNETFTGPGLALVTGPPLPAPCVIESVYIHPTELANTNEWDWNLLLIEQEFIGVAPIDFGERLIEPFIGPNTGGGSIDQIPFGIRAAHTPAGENVPGVSIYPLGRTITENGKRLAFAARIPNLAVQTIRAEAVVTIALCADTSRVVTRTATPKPAPKPRVTRAPAPRVLKPARVIPKPPPPPPVRRGDIGTGARPISGGRAFGGQLITRWTTPNIPGMTFATEREVQIAEAAQQFSSLPRQDRDAEALRIQNLISQRQPQRFVVHTPLPTLLRGQGARPFFF